MTRRSLIQTLLALPIIAKLRPATAPMTPAAAPAAMPALNGSVVILNSYESATNPALAWSAPPPALSVIIQGSHDGVTWTEIDPTI